MIMTKEPHQVRGYEGSVITETAGRLTFMPSHATSVLVDVVRRLQSLAAFKQIAPNPPWKAPRSPHRPDESLDILFAKLI
jgi:hypothetical protein